MAIDVNSIKIFHTFIFQWTYWKTLNNSLCYCGPSKFRFLFIFLNISPSDFMAHGKLIQLTTPT